MKNLAIALLLTVSVPAFCADSSIENGFVNPPDSSRPHTLWQWASGHVSKEGITKDLESFKAVGLDGIELFSTHQFNVHGNTPFNSERFYDCIDHTISEAERLGLDFCINNASGWSSTGGPWIKLEDSMKQIIWSETSIVPGQNPVTLEKSEKIQRSFYRDIAVLAFPAPKNSKHKLAYWTEKGLNDRKRRSDKFSPDKRIAPADAIIAKDSILNLTDRMQEDGKLDWTPEDGEWIVMRIGFTTTGARVHPANQGGAGFECDKLSRRAMDIHWENYLDKIIAVRNGRSTLSTFLIDSFEPGMQNWTDGFHTIFAERNGYELIPHLVCLSGRIIESTEYSERFLWDFRKTIADLMRENYYEYFAEKCREHGLKFMIEPYGGGTFDAAEIAQIADIPMHEFWQADPRNLWQWTGQIAPSGAHLTGRKIVSAEAYTAMNGDFSAYPAKLKRWGDLAIAGGINRFYFHSATHQPWNDEVVPGMTMGRFGGNFHRSNTWWPHSRPWMDYIARCHHVMQDGVYVADLLYLYGDEYAFTCFMGRKEPSDLPNIPGFNLDIGHLETLDRLSVDTNGDIRVTFEGELLSTRYQMLILKRASLMRPEYVAKLGELAQQGASIIAPRPIRSPRLAGHEAADAELAKLIAEYWDTGLIKEDTSFDETIASITKDLEAPEYIAFNHYKLEDGDYYFISNQKEKPVEVKLRFRISGKEPELWNPLTGAIQRAPNWKVLNNSITEVRLDLNEIEALFVVFREPTESKGESTPKPRQLDLLELAGPWNVEFHSKRADIKPQTFEELTSWSEHEVDAIKHYSGTATYRTTFDWEHQDGEVYLDLEDIQVIASVRLNGVSLGTLWAPPFRAKITDALNDGTNTLEIDVTNLWVNRLIGDERYPDLVKRTGWRNNPAIGRLTEIPEWLDSGQPLPNDTERQTFVAFQHWGNDSDLAPSGLIGSAKLTLEKDHR